MTERLVLFFDYANVLDDEITEDDAAFADRQGWQWPLYRCPLCTNMVGTFTTFDGLTVIDQHFFDLNGHWRQCGGSWALAVLTFNSVTAAETAPTPVDAVLEELSPPQTPPGRKRPSRAAKARRRRYQRRPKPPRAA